MTLDEYLWKNKIRGRDFAGLVEASDSMISAVKSAIRRPSIELAKRIEKATKGAVSATELLGLADKKPRRRAARARHAG